MTGRVRRFAAGFSVEGIGFGLTYRDPWVFCDESYKAAEANALGTSDYRWTNGRCGEPSASGYSTDPFRGDINTSSLTLFLHNRDDLAERFRFTDTKPTTVVSSDIASGDTTVTLDDTTLTNTNVYIGDETIRLDTHSGWGTYSVDRAIWGSEAQAHSAADNVYTRGAPHWRGRRVRYVVLNLETGEERVPWRGYVKDIETADDGTKIKLSVGELVAASIKGEVNTNAQPINHDLEVRRVSSGRKIVQGSLLTANTDEVFFQSQIREASEWNSSGKYIWVQCDGALVLCRENQPIDYYPSLRMGSTVETDIEDGEFTADLEDEVFEVFVVSPAADALVQSQFDSGDWASSTGGLRALGGFYNFDSETAVHHPWSVGLALLNSGTGQTSDLSAWEELRDAWGLGFGWAMQEGLGDANDTVRALIEQFPYLRIDNLVLGWDGDPVNPWRTAIYQCFIPYGLIPGVTNEGLPTFKRFGLLDIEQYNDALGNKLTPILNTNAQKGGHGSTADRIIGVVGELPWRKPDRIEERAQGNSKRNAKIADQQKFEIDYSTVSPENYDAVAGNLLSQSRLAHYAMPRWVLRFDDYDIDDVDYTVGEYVSLSRWPVKGSKPIDPSTGKVTLDVEGKAWATGLTIGRTPSFDDHTYELEILLTSYIIDQPARWRAPAMVVTSSTELASTTKIYTDATSNFGFGEADNNAFFVGDDVAGWTAGGTFVASAGEIVSIGSDGTGDYIEVDLVGSVSAGLVIRLYDFDTYANPSALPNVDRVWAFLADNNETLGASADEGDVYGTLWVGPANISDYTGDYDGGTFVALDNELVRADEPADTFVDHALRNDEFYLYQNASRFPVEFSCSTNSIDIQKDTSERLLTGLSWMTIAMGRFPVQKGLDTIKSFWHAGVCDTAFNGNGEVEIMMELVTDVGVVQRTTSTLTDTTADTIEVQEHELTLDLTDIPTSDGARLLFKVRGKKSSTNTGDTTPSYLWPDRLDFGATGTYEQGFFLTDTDGNPLGEAIQYTTFASVAAMHPARDDLPDTLQAHAIGALALRGINVETTYRGGGEGFVEYAQEEVAAQQAVGSSVTQRHQRNANHILTRPKIRVFGACGEDDGEMDDIRHEYMPWVEFSSGGRKGQTQIGPSRSVPLAADPCRLDVSMDFLCVQAGAFLPDTDEIFRWMQENAATVEINIGVTVTEIATATVFSQNRNTTLDFYPSSRLGPYMSMHMWSRQGVNTSWRSGHLNDSDLTLLQRLTLPISVSGVDVTNPVKIDAYAYINSFEKVLDGTLFGTGPKDLTDFRLQMCGFSVVESN